jgi:hypothetical protein
MAPLRYATARTSIDNDVQQHQLLPLVKGQTVTCTGITDEGSSRIGLIKSNRQVLTEPVQLQHVNCRVKHAVQDSVMVKFPSNDLLLQVRMVWSTTFTP